MASGGRVEPPGAQWSSEGHQGPTSVKSFTGSLVLENLKYLFFHFFIILVFIFFSFTFSL